MKKSAKTQWIACLGSAVLLSACNANVIENKTPVVVNNTGQTSSNQSATPDRKTNQKPIIQQFSTNPGNVVISQGDKITFTVVATDGDGDPLIYTWVSTKGVLSSTAGQTNSWSPQRTDGVLESGVATVSVIVSDGKEIATSSVNIQIAAGRATVDEGSKTTEITTPELQTKVNEVLSQLLPAAPTTDVNIIPVEAPVQTPAPTVTLAPSSTPYPSVTPAPSSTPTATPTPTSTPTATPTPPASPAYSPTPSPTPSATSDISVVEKTTLNGIVFDDTNAPLDGVRVTAKSLNSSVPFEATTTTAGGSYAFNNAPAGVTIEIAASRAGYATRRRVEVLKSNKIGDPNANRYDFGGNTGFGVSYNALSDKPEVTSVNPGRNASGVPAATSFVLKFSEPMDRATVQDSFAIYAYNNKNLTVDTSGGSTVSAGARIWDKAAFNASWNSDDTEVTFTFKEERQLPTDRDASKIPDYRVDLDSQNGVIKDKSGISRIGSKFKLTDSDFEAGYKFSIQTDTRKPTLSGITAQTNENQGINGDAIKVQFSERMIHYTLSTNIAGGMGGDASQAAAANSSLSAAQAAGNYIVTVMRGGATVQTPVSWASLGGTAIFDTNDPTHKTVILLPPAGSDIYKPGDNVSILVAPGVADPAGNSLDSSASSASANAS